MPVPPMRPRLDYVALRANGRYPSSPGMVLAFKCNYCGHEIAINGKGIPAVNRARTLMKHHLYRCKPSAETTE